MKRVIPLLLGGIAAACGVIQLAQPLSFTSNTCATTPDCLKEFPPAAAEGGTTTCSGGSCVDLNGAFVPILIVSPQLDNPFVGGATVALPAVVPANVSGISLPGGACTIAGPNCVPLPALADLTPGMLEVTQALGIALWPPTGLVPNQPQSFVTLPVDAIIHPMWIDPASQQPILAKTLGLPLPDIIAANNVDVQHAGCDFLTTPPPAPTTADAGGTPFVFCAHPPQPYTIADPTNVYEIETRPRSPFDVFPPMVREFRLLVGSSGFITKEIDLGTAISQAQSGALASLIYEQVNLDTPPKGANPITATSYAIQLAPGGTVTSLDGWTMYVLDADGHRISSIATLADGVSQSVTLYDATASPVKTGTMFVDPPPTLDAPRMSFPPLAGAFFPPPYPALPPSVVTSGVVLDAQQRAATATITVVADGSPTAYVVGTEANGSPPEQQLLYSKTTSTNASAQYSMSVPPGVYTAYVVPDDPTLAITKTTNNQILATGARGLFVNPRTHVKGRVVRADQTPVYGAQVVIDPWADGPFSANPDPLAWPREATGTTDANGNFDVLSDAGLVDISIRPADGTHLPWVVLTRTLVAPNVATDAGGAVSVTVPNVTIPLPTPHPPNGQAGVLTDSAGNVLPRAMIRAYAFPPPDPVPDGGTPTPRGARLVGMTMSDDSGNFQLFTVPPDP